ncbi:MAG: hypothetical protein U1E42_03670 [Rhodospirillales bacterium]
MLGGMAKHIDTGANNAFRGLLIVMRLIWGRLFRPMLVANAAGFVWCVYSAF